MNPKADHPKVWRLKCSRCERFNDQNRGTYVDGNDLAGPLRAVGWRVACGLKPLCPSCKGKPSRPPSAQVIQLPAACFWTGQPREKNAVDLKLQRAIIEALGEYFDEKNGRYINAWSDEKIAQATGAAVGIVADVRKAAFGELAEDPELTSLRSAIDAATSRAAQLKAEMDKDLAEVRRRFDSYVQARRPRIAS